MTTKIWLTHEEQSYIVRPKPSVRVPWPSHSTSRFARKSKRSCPSFSVRPQADRKRVLFLWISIFPIRLVADIIITTILLTTSRLLNIVVFAHLYLHNMRYDIFSNVHIYIHGMTPSGWLQRLSAAVYAIFLRISDREK